MKIETLIAGGGLAGLSCARELAENSRSYLLVESEQEIGGLCRTVLTRGFAFDYTGHFLHFQKPEMKKWALKHTGAAFKACKGQSQSLLLAAAAQKYSMFLCVQDLTCPGASLIHSAGLAVSSWAWRWSSVR